MGKILLHQEGMFTPVRLDLTDLLKEQNELQVKIRPIPKMHGEPADRNQAAASVKPAVSYGWDWHPRLVPWVSGMIPTWKSCPDHIWRMYRCSILK